MKPIKYRHDLTLEENLDILIKLLNKYPAKSKKAAETLFSVFGIEVSL